MAPVIDVSELNFAQAVLQASYTAPVVVDFWAAWCGPCRMLGPVLEQLAGEADGAWTLAKLDTEASPNLARQFGISSIPAVKAFVDGQVVDEFVGALPKAQISAWLQRIVPSPADRALAAGQILQALQLDPRHPGALLAAADQAIKAGDRDTARHLLQVLEEGEVRRLPADQQGLLAALKLALSADDGQDPDEMEDQLLQQPDQLPLRLQLAALRASRGEWKAAVDQWLEVIRRDRGELRDQARQAMVDGLQACQDKALAQLSRQRLSMAWFA